MEQQKKKTTRIDCNHTVLEYIDKQDWRINANANTNYSHASLVNNSSGKIVANFWLDYVYSPEEGDAHRNGDYHIHDLDILAPYCCGHDFQRLLQEGFNGVRGRVNSKPPKHLSEALYQLANFLGILQAEWAGAQAVSSFDTYLAPYLFFDKYWEGMTSKKLKRVMRNFVYNLNVPSRWGQCVPETYKCLKGDGTWVNYKNLQVGDEIATVDMETGRLRTSYVDRVNVFDSPDKLHRYTDGEGFSFEVTDKHRIIHKTEGGKWVLTESADLLKESVEAKIPTAMWCPIDRSEYMSNEIPLDDAFIELFTIAYIFGKVGEDNILRIYTANSNLVERIMDICEELEIKHKISADKDKDGVHVFEVDDDYLVRMLTDEKNNRGSFLHYFSPRQINIFIDTWSIFSGSFNGNMWTLLTPNKATQEFLSGLVLKTGKSAVCHDYIDDITGMDVHQLQIHKRVPKTVYGRVVDSKYEKVWCPTTSDSTFVCMNDDGQIFFTGNSPFTNVTIDWTVPQTLKDLVPSRGDGSYFQSVKDEWDLRDSCPETREDLEESWKTFADEEKKKIKDEEWEKFAQHAIKRYEEVTKQKFDGDSSEIWLYLTYSFFQKEMNEINKAFYEVLNEGDEQGLPFTFPIPTINITEDFDWNGENTDLLFENTAKMGSSYFQNFIGSQYKRDENGKLVRDENAYSPNDVRSMCCRLQLDKKQLRKRGGGLFGSDAQTGCYDDQTEVLTNKGWKFFKDLTLDDELYTLNSDYNIELHKPKKLFKYEWDDNLVRMRSKTVDLLVTPNHRMVTGSKNDKQLGFCYAKDIKNYIVVPNKTNGIKSCRSPKFKKIGNKKIKAKDWCEFLGWYITEGSYTMTNSGAYRVRITQHKEAGRAKIRNVLNRLPFKHHETKTDFEIYNKALYEEVSSLGRSDEKHIPEYVFYYDKKSLAALYDALIEGDGTKDRRNYGLHSYYTISKQLADDVQRLMILLGNGANSLYIQRKTRNASHYKINRSISETRVIKKNNISQDYYCGFVYCAEVENHTMCVRRNGRAIWCGNSIGVVTLNMARLGYKHKDDKDGLYKDVDRLMDMAKSTLEKKRKFVTEMFNRGLYPYTRRYVRTFDTYFSTIGVNGMNEMVRNFTNDQFDITSPEGQKMCLEILQHIRERLISYQEETGNLYNLEATPAEGTMRRFAHLDKSKYPDIIQAGFDGGTPYYTNSSQLPVDFTSDVFTALDLQDDLQKMYTGGCVGAGNYVSTNKGEILIEDIVKNFKKEDGLLVRSWNNESKKVEWDKIVEAVKIDVSKYNKIKVSLMPIKNTFNKANFDIITSDWHPFLVEDGENIVEVRADDLKEGQLVIGMSNFNDEQDIVYFVSPPPANCSYMVVKTSKIDVEDNQFYDLMTEKNHNYLCGNSNGRVFIHNTVLHLYMRERVSTSEACKHLVKSVLTNYRLPYISVTPTFSVCPIHGRLEGEQEFCPLCDAELIRKHAEEVDTNL